jgi:hypothetical protein
MLSYTSGLMIRFLRTLKIDPFKTKKCLKRVSILKTQFPQKQSDESFTNPRSRVQLQLLSTNNAKRRKRWCDDHKTWTYDDWKYVMW